MYNVLIMFFILFQHRADSFWINWSIQRQQSTPVWNKKNMGCLTPLSRRQGACSMVNMCPYSGIASQGELGNLEHLDATRQHGNRATKRDQAELGRRRWEPGGRLLTCRPQQIQGTMAWATAKYCWGHPCRKSRVWGSGLPVNLGLT